MFHTSMSSTVRRPNEFGEMFKFRCDMVECNLWDRLCANKGQDANLQPSIYQTVVIAEGLMEVVSDLHHLIMFPKNQTYHKTQHKFVI